MLCGLPGIGNSISGRGREMKAARANSYLRIAAFVAGLLLPALSLIPLGSIWLWQQGYILHWAIATGLFVCVAFLIQRRMFRTVVTEAATTDSDDPKVPADRGDPSWTPAEERAWKDVVARAQAVDVGQLTSRDAIIGLGTETVRIVAQRLHPEVAEPLWQFTVPEAFAIIERVCRRLGSFTVENIPLSDRLTVAQAMALYEWRGAVGMAEKAYDVWRLIRLANPLTAATQELRERLSRQMLQWGRTHVTQRLAYAFVTEVGRAAIDLYGGRLRVSAVELSVPPPAASSAEATDLSGSITQPLRILIGGQVGAGKSSLVNALASELRAEVDALPATAQFTTYQLRHSEMPGAQLIDSPGLGSTDGELNMLISQAVACDLVLWVVAAHRADREIDRKAIATVRDTFLARPNRRQPPILLVLSHVDRLRPLLEWAPPYDLGSAEQPKSVSIRAVVDEVARELGFVANDVVPVSLLPAASYNIDTLWARVLMVLPDAQRAQFVRRLQESRADWNWQRIWTQAVSGGRVLGRTLTGREQL